MSADYYSIDPMKETEQTLLEKIIQKHLQKFGQNNLFLASLDHFRETGTPSGSFRESLHELMNEYATAKAQASCEATLKKASDNAKIKADVDPIYEGGDILYFIDKDSITDPKNITIV